MYNNKKNQFTFYKNSWNLYYKRCKFGVLFEVLLFCSLLQINVQLCRLIH
jgi:hypothetical protein